MVLHGAGWFKPEAKQFWNRADLLYIRLLMPLYCRKASAIVSVSELTTDTFNRIFDLPRGKVRTVYFGPGRDFQRVEERARLQRVREKYRLPEQYILTLSGYDRGDRKNMKGILNGYKGHYGKTAHQLVIGGKDCHRFKQDWHSDTGYGGTPFTD
jgi:hypothetical protein